MSSTVVRSLRFTFKAKGFGKVSLVNTIRPSAFPYGFSNTNRNLHNSTPRTQSSIDSGVIGTKVDESTPSYSKRFRITAEVIVSKIFPAGFGWQSGSIIATQSMNFATDSVSFAMMTGAGDALGVFLGHCGYFALKKSITGNPKILMSRERDTGILLASAAFCSGSIWQPLVNSLQGAELCFNSVFAGTWIGCSTAFYFGLRAARTVLPRFLNYVEEPTYENSKTDAALSLSIGGATGFFVGTDTAYLPQQNFLIDIVGITEGTSNLSGCVLAGSSTTLGFSASQTVLNITYPKGKCWND